MNHMGRAGLLLAVAISLLLASCGTRSPAVSASQGSQGSASCAYNSGDNSCTMVHDNATRQFLVHVPPKFVANSSALIVALAPSRTSNAAFETMSGWSHYADSLPSPQPIVVYPQALLTAPTSTEDAHLAWNTFFACSIFPQPCPNDSDFIRQIILITQTHMHPNTKATYVTGFSLGALMASRVAIEQSDLVAAVAAYEFPLGTTDGLGGAPIPNATAPVSALYIDGDHSGVPNICGYLSGSNFQSSVDQDISYWSSGQNDSCSGFDTSLSFCTGQYNTTGDGIQTSLTEKHSSGCSSSTDLQVYKLIGGQHTYYCSNNSGCSPVVAFNNTACDATTPCNPQLNSATGTTLNDIIWNFLEAHPKP